MKRHIICLLCFLLFVHLSDARNKHPEPKPSKPLLAKSFRARVYFSSKVPVNGVATEGKEFFINPEGSYIYAIVDNYPNAFNFDQIKVKIFRTEGSLQMKEYDTRTYNIDGSRYFTFVKYSFYEAGTYTFDVYSGSGEYIGSGSVVIRKSSAVPASATSTSGSDRYAKSRVYFSTEVPSYGIAKNVKSFKLKPGGGYIYVIVDNYPTNFNVSALKLYMYKLNDGVYAKMDEVSYDINGGYYFTYFKYVINESGTYKFVVYDNRSRYINTGYVTISW